MSTIAATRFERFINARINFCFFGRFLGTGHVAAVVLRHEDCTDSGENGDESSEDMV